MKRHVIPTLIATAIIFGLVRPAAAEPFKDANLEAAVRAVLQIQDPKAALTDAQLMNVFVLNASGKGDKKVKDLTGLEKCKNLLELTLANNEITDLAPLKGLTNIQSLDLANNKITDVAPLAELKKLQRLVLSGNEIAKVDALGGLTTLTSLFLTGNKVSDIKPLGNLTKLS